MKKYKVSSTLFYIASVLSFISAIFYFVNSDTSIGVLWIANSTVWLYLGFVYRRKAKGNDDNSKNNKADCADY